MYTLSETSKNAIIDQETLIKSNWDSFTAIPNKTLNSIAATHLENITACVMKIDSHLKNVVKNTANPFIRKKLLEEFSSLEWTVMARSIMPKFMFVKIDEVGYFLPNIVYHSGFSYADGSWVNSTGELLHNYNHVDILGASEDPRLHLDYKYLPTDVSGFTGEEDVAGQRFEGMGRGMNGSTLPVLFMGVELEVERKSSTYITAQLARITQQKDLGRDFVILKSDSSINDGYEIVSAPATLAYHKQAWDKFFNNSAKHLSSFAGGRCGMHVHMSRDAFSPLHLGKLVSFYNNPINRDLIVKIAGRDGNHYAEFQSHNTIMNKMQNVQKNAKAATGINSKVSITEYNYKELANVKHSLDRSGGNHKYSVVNLSKDPTIEIRIFRGNVSRIGFLKNIEFVHAVYEFTKLASYRSVSLTTDSIKPESYGLTTKDFLAWLSADTSPNYNNLKVWLATSSFMKYKKLDDTKKKKPEYQKFNINKEEVTRCA